MNVLDSRCSVLTIQVFRGTNFMNAAEHQIQIPSQIRYKCQVIRGTPDTKLVNTLHLESNTFICFSMLNPGIPPRLAFGEFFLLLSNPGICANTNTLVCFDVWYLL